MSAECRRKALWRRGTVFGAAVVSVLALSSACTSTDSGNPPAPPPQSGAPASPAVPDLLSAPGPITVDGVAHDLAWSSAPRAGYYKQEYLPEGQTLEQFQSLVLLELLTTRVDLTELAGTQVRAMQERNRVPGPLQFEILTNETQGEVLLDYIVFGTSTNNVDTAEWNVYRYAHNEFGTVLFAHSRRAYGPDQARFLQDLKTLRPRLVNEHATRPLPVVRP